MNGPRSTLRRAVIIVAAAFLLPILHAEESGSPDRPERFLMLLKTGDKVEWSTSSEPNGYRVTIFSEDKFQELVKAREARETELRSLNKKLKGNVAISFEDMKSEDPQVKERVKDVERLRFLSVRSRGNSRYGQVTHVGADYIAIMPLKEEQERFMPAWSIISIQKSKTNGK